MRFEAGVELVEDHTGFDAYCAFFDIEFKQPVHMPRKIELQTGADRLPCLRSTAAAGSDRSAVLAA